MRFSFAMLAILGLAVASVGYYALPNPLLCNMWCVSD